ncbi:MAG: NAD-dependent epimerase/dehydratase family protein [Acidimicrobiales bacterium]|nr:NAD-dependent epimerase/dehydratase family protein [Acidimicrobiales bacterium]
MSPHPTHVVLGAGPVGRAVVASLVARGIHPVVVTRSGASVPGARSRIADVSDPAQVAEAVAGADVVFQCAQPEYHRWPEEFPALQAGIVDAAAAAGALLVVAENLYGYGPHDGPLTEGLPLAATTRKGAVRARMWRDLEAAHEAGRLRVVAGRASDFFGPGVEGSAVGERFFGPLAAGKAAEIAGDPDRLHTYTYVGDFGEALVRLSETPATWGRAWHVPNAPTGTTRTLAEQAALLAGTTPRLRTFARWQLRLVGLFVPPVRETVEMLYEFEHDFVVDHSAYAAHCGDHATPLAESLAVTVAAERGTATTRSGRVVG